MILARKYHACVPLKVHKNENFLDSILNFVLFHCKLGINNKILGNIFLLDHYGGSYDYFA